MTELKNELEIKEKNHFKITAKLGRKQEWIKHNHNALKETECEKGKKILKLKNK